VDSLALVFSSGWASGVNAYLVVLVLGLTDRFGDVAGIPDALGRTDVLLAAAAMFALEFVADKVPYLDSAWDAVSTLIRPTVGAVVGVLIAGDAATLDQAVAGVVGGGTALLSHTVKASSRLAINSSPEPVSNVVASVAEDVTVLALMWFAVEHPRAAAALAGVLLLVGLVVVYLVARLVRRGWQRLRGRRTPPTAPPRQPGAPPDGPGNPVVPGGPAR
jgi:uncharacterized membrane protein (GlpM family)